MAATGGAKTGGTQASTLGSANGKRVGHRNTTGWSPSCACDAGDPVPCTVLDPFGGAGTTGLVAERLGRDSVLIELNPDYAAQATARIRADIGKVEGNHETEHDAGPLFAGSETGKFAGVGE